VINELNKKSPIEIFPTFLGAHAIPENKEKEQYIEQILFEMLPLVAQKKLAAFIDVFCENGYFTAEETGVILQQGKKFGLIPKLHTNQFYSIGGIKAAVENNVISADHLEVMKPTDIELLKDKGIIACLLPGVSYFLDIGYAPARKLIESNIPVALATDFNPGTCMTENIQFIMSLAAQKLKMNTEEIINAVTINGAAALGISDKTGSIEVGKKGDIVIFDMPDYRHLIYHFGVNHLEKVIKNGEVVKL
ncbi:MAG: amidohydrolase family protein, partial [Ignavibacteria bacterium]